MRGFIIAGLVLLAPLAQVQAQAPEPARELNYCERLYEIAYRYVTPVRRTGTSMRDARADLGVDLCRRGRFSEGIPMLEARLQNDRIPLPER